MAGLSAGQKDNIAVALPTGFSKLLGGHGCSTRLAGAARDAAEAANQAARTAGSAVYTAGNAGQRAVAGLALAHCGSQRALAHCGRYDCCSGRLLAPGVGEVLKPTIDTVKAKPATLIA